MPRQPIRRPNGQFAGSAASSQLSDLWVGGGQTIEVPELIVDTSEEEARLQARYDKFRSAKQNSSPSARTRIAVNRVAEQIAEVMQINDLSGSVAQEPRRRWDGQEVAQVLGYELPGHTGHTATGAVEWSTARMSWQARPQCIVLKKNGTRFRPEFESVGESSDASEALSILIPHLARVKAQELALLSEMRALTNKYAAEFAVLGCGLPRVARHGQSDGKSLVVFDNHADGDEPVSPGIRRAQIELHDDGIFEATVFDYRNYVLPQWFYGPEGKKVRFLVPNALESSRSETFTGAATWIAEHTAIGYNA